MPGGYHNAFGPLQGFFQGTLPNIQPTDQAYLAGRIFGRQSQYSAGSSTGSAGGATTALDNLAAVAIIAALVLGTSDAFALGSATKQWSDLFLASGAVIDCNNGNATITHSAGLFTSSVDLVVPDEAYAAGWNGSLEVPTKNAVFDKIETMAGAATASLWTNYIYGFATQYSSAAAVVVGFPNANGPTSICRDKADAAFITLAAGTTYATNNDVLGGPQENDSFTGPGTIATNGTTAITGTSTTFLTSFGTRAGTGTYSTSGTAVTGSGTKFLSELAVNDLVGDATNGYCSVTAIASDTSCTISAALPNGTPSGVAFNIIEQPTIYHVDGAVGYFVTKITSNTALTITTAIATDTTSVYYVGYCVADVAPTAGVLWNYVWVSKGGTGTTAFVSTQRTTPFGYGSFGIAEASHTLNGYLTSVRRIGSTRAPLGIIAYFTQVGRGADRNYMYDTSTSYLVVNTGTATSWTEVSLCRNYAPPTAMSLLMDWNLLDAQHCYLRRRNFGDATISRNLVLLSADAQYTAGTAEVQCDGVQLIDYAFGTSVGSALFLYVYGYKEGL